MRTSFKLMHSFASLELPVCSLVDLLPYEASTVLLTFNSMASVDLVLLYSDRICS